MTASCFDGDTPVLTANGSFCKIECLLVGELVMSRCEKTGKVAPKRVLRNFERSDVFHAIKCTGGPQYRKDWPKDSPEYLYATASHPFWVLGRGWTPVRELRERDRLLSHNEDPITVEYVLTPEEFAKPYRPTAAPVHDLEVEDFHTYFVGTAGVWVRGFFSEEHA